MILMREYLERYGLQSTDSLMVFFRRNLSQQSGPVAIYSCPTCGGVFDDREVETEGAINQHLKACVAQWLDKPF